MNRNDFQELAEARLADAQVLLDAGRYDAAYYFAGYVVECALKACIAKQTKEHDFPIRDVREKFYTHDVGKLRESAGLAGAFEQEFRNDPELASSWNLVKDWDEAARYQTHGREKAEAMLRAISDPQHGVLQCLRKYW